MKTLILSLPNDEKRRQSCADQLGRFGMRYEFVDAIHGDQIADEEFRQLYDREQNRKSFKRPLSRNEVACTLGHRRIWKTIADSNAPLALVLEDDATFLRDPRPLLNALHAQSGVFEDTMIKLDGVPRKNIHKVMSVADQTLLMSNHLPARTTGYVLGRGAAARLARLANPIARPIDIDLKFYWEHGVPILTLQERMIEEAATLSSHIEARRRLTKPRTACSRLSRNLRFQFKYNFGRLTHPVQPPKRKDQQPTLWAAKPCQDQQ